MSMTDLIAVNSTSGYRELPTPSTYRVISQKILSEESKRNVEALMNLQVINVKNQIIMTWNLISTEDFALLCRLTEGRTTPGKDEGIAVAYFNPQTNSIQYGDFYRDTSFNYNVAGPWDGGPNHIIEVSMTLTEM